MRKLQQILMDLDQNQKRNLDDIENKELIKDLYNSKDKNYEVNTESNICSICNGLSMIEVHDGYTKCPACYDRNLTIRSLKNHGLYDRVINNTFENFIIENEEQDIARSKSIDYIETFDKTKSIMFSGQIGAGKTHLALAIINELIGETTVNVLMYTEDIAKLKIDKNSYYPENKRIYEEKMKGYKECGLLLIEDLFWGVADKESLAVMYDILNYRYNNNKSMIITTELNKENLLSLDQALGSRLIELCDNGNFIIEFQEDLRKNYRLK